MSMPNIPNIEPKITFSREDAVNLLIASVALEEIGLAHIINAEAEKIQSVLGTLEGQKVKDPTEENLLKINASVESTLKDIIKKEMLLEFKLENAIKLAEKKDNNDNGNGNGNGKNDNVDPQPV
jgi:hypothetical protein